MNLLSEILLEDELKHQKIKILELSKKYNFIKSRIGTIKEGVLDFENEEIESMFDEAKRRFVASKRALGLANKLQDPESRKQNKSRILASMNRLRNLIKNISVQLDKEYYQLQRKTDDPIKSTSYNFSKGDNVAAYYPNAQYLDHRNMRFNMNNID